LPPYLAKDRNRPDLIRRTSPTTTSYDTPLATISARHSRNARVTK
jgi:hypothetical protein